MQPRRIASNNINLIHHQTPQAIRTYQPCHLMKLFILIMLSMGVTACSDAGDPESYIGTWTSDFSDTDANGHKVGQAWRLKIGSDHSFALQSKTNPDDDWRYSQTGKIEGTTVSVDGFDKPGIRFGTCKGTMYAGGLDAMVEGELRTFKRAGQSRVILTNIALIVVAIVLIRSFLAKKTKPY